MADIIIPDMQLRDLVTDEVNFPIDDGTQSYRITAAQLRAFIRPAPVGTVLDFAGSTAPTGFLFCFGQVVDRVDYPALYSVIGDQFPGGNGTTNFALPDCRGRVAAGKDDMGGVAANRLTTGGSGVNGAVRGASGGAETHTLTSTQMPSHTHTQNAHNHGVNDPGHVHVMSGGLSGGGDQVLHDGVGNATGRNTNASGTGITVASQTAVNQSTGGDGAHNNVQPTIIFNKIIKF